MQPLTPPNTTPKPPLPTVPVYRCDTTVLSLCGATPTPKRPWQRRRPIEMELRVDSWTFACNGLKGLFLVGSEATLALTGAGVNLCREL